MPAYVILLREEPVHTPEEMQEYLRKGQLKPPPATLLPLAVYGAMTPLEGELPDGAVILQFPSVDDAKAWYFSEHYQDASQHRRASAPYRAFIVEGFEPPAA
jgi:uncharacterized protein (DUF1330 family)